MRELQMKPHYIIDLKSNLYYNQILFVSREVHKTTRIRYQMFKMFYE